jgi:ElaB/YqjD/DUF883 family membrane-anchored ribosome-binding protein
MTENVVVERVACAMAALPGWRGVCGSGTEAAPDTKSNRRQPPSVPHRGGKIPIPTIPSLNFHTQRNRTVEIFRLIHGFKLDTLSVESRLCNPRRAKPQKTRRYAMSEVTDFPNNSKEKLVADMKVVVSDAEEILRATTGVAEDKIGELRERFADHLRDAKLRIADAEDVLFDRTRAVARATDDYVNENPWRAVAIGAGIGLLLGILIGRR